MKYLSTIFLLFCLSCSYDSIALNTGHGQASSLLTNNYNNYKIKTVAIECIKDNFSLEFNFSDHEYKDFNCLSFGSKLHFFKDYKWLFADIGAGFRLTEFDERNELLADSYLLGDLSFSVGIKKEFEKFDVKLSYTLQHLSVPWRHDKGLNYDVFQFGVVISF